MINNHIAYEDIDPRERAGQSASGAAPVTVPVVSPPFVQPDPFKFDPSPAKEPDVSVDQEDAQRRAKQQRRLEWLRNQPARASGINL